MLDTKAPEDRPGFDGGGGGVIINGGVPADGQEIHIDASGATGGVVAQPGVSGVVAAEAVASQLETAGDMANASRDFLEQMQGIAEQMARLNETTEALNEVSRTLLGSYQAITENSESVSSNSKGYVSQMEDLNRNIAGLNTIYEIQLKSISSQLESIDRVNRGLKDIRDMYDKAANESSRYCEETEKMARYMKQLNSVYEKMITAMTINMQNPMMGAGMSSGNPFDESINNHKS